MKKTALILFALCFLFTTSSITVNLFENEQVALPPVLDIEESESVASTIAPTPSNELTGIALVESAEIPASVSSSPTIDYQLLYQPVFDSYRLFLSGEEITLADNTERQDYYLIMGETGISLLCRYGGIIGYRFQDLNDDGLPEMLVSAIGSDYYDGYLYDMYTLIDEVPSRVLVSSERVRYQLTTDNRIYHEASAGAGLNICFLYSFDGTSLVLEDGVVMNEGSYFESTEEHTNIFEKTEADREISEEEYFALSESWRSMVTNVEITAF